MVIQARQRMALSVTRSLENSADSVRVLGALVLCRASTVAGRVIELTRLDERFAVRADLPCDWPVDGEGSDPDAPTLRIRYESR